MAKPPRIAIAQPTMHWTADANTASMLEAIEIAAARDAEICVFPELAVTGFHRRIVDYAPPGSIDRHLDAIRRSCARHRVAATFGAPIHADARIRNSQCFVDADGLDRETVDKRGLTPAEATFFAAGAAPRAVFEWRGLRCTSVICREIEDHDPIVAELEAAKPDLVFWPGLMGPEAGSEHVDPPRHVQQAQKLACSLGAWIVQANWSTALNDPERSPQTGRSAVVSPAGELVFRLPRAEPGIGTFTLGDSCFDWIPLDADATMAAALAMR